MVERDGDGVVDGDDCAPDDPARARRWANLYEDLDSDGYARGGPAEACLGPSEAPSDAGFAAQSAGEDCNDADPNVAVTRPVYGDGDGVGAGPYQIPCLGATLPAGLSIYGDDVDDADPGLSEDEESFTILF